MGHESITTARISAHLSDDELAAVAAAVGSLAFFILAWVALPLLLQVRRAPAAEMPRGRANDVQ